MRGSSTTTKVFPFHHLDAVLMTAGVTDFQRSANWFVMQAASEVATFDELIAVVHPWLQAAWADVVAKGHSSHGGYAFLVGYSHEAEEFVGYAMAELSDFVPQRIDGPFCHPSPGRRSPPRSSSSAPWGSWRRRRTRPTRSQPFARSGQRVRLWTHLKAFRDCCMVERTTR